ncbi:hypothetical protein [Streptomyces luteireticuli]|uniref:hypothetical protein n=1 Tax=Streptomyces luteireticuli TaxID=173858 RepID=UPI003555C78E
MPPQARSAELGHPVYPYSISGFGTRTEMHRALTLYADVIAALEAHVTDVDMDNCANRLAVVVHLAEDQYVTVTGRRSLPHHPDRTELGGWTATYIDDQYGHSQVLYDTTTPEGEPPGDMSLTPLAETVGDWVNTWHVAHQQ